VTKDHLNARELLATCAATLLDDGRDLSLDDLSSLCSLDDEYIPTLAAFAHQVRIARLGPRVEVEGILSAKTGGCPEDCHFCSQSARFPTPVRPTAVLDLDEILAAALETERLGATEFCIVAAVRGPDHRLIDQVLAATTLIRTQTGLQVACSLGILTRAQARALAAGGVHRYNHNLETARSFFGEICTTHTWEERVQTCGHVKDAGMELCCGVIIGMGESDDQRIEMLGQLRNVRPTEVPINFLNPRPGTPLARSPLVEPLEAIRWIALFRLALPNVILRYAGGREITLRDLQAMGLTAGINALIVGNYLTTLGRRAQEDLQMLEDLRMPLRARAK
jgi:biotin synthase